MNTFQYILQTVKMLKNSSISNVLIFGYKKPQQPWNCYWIVPLEY